MKRTLLTMMAFSIAILLTGMQAQAQPDPTLPRINPELYASGFDSITDIANAGDDRLFVVEQQGRIWIIDGSGTTLATPFLDIHDQMMLDGNERGLLGLTFDPDYPNNGYFYVNYTSVPDGRTHISRFQVSADPNVADETTEQIVLMHAQPFRNHNAGDIEFGFDGYLYIPLGDGGAANDLLENAQDGSSLLGKMLRIDVSTLPYTIPADNPYVGATDTMDEIWAFGLRNPYSFTVDRLTGDHWIADAGQNVWEEVNYEPENSAGGMNWGWDCYEADAVFEPAGCGDASLYDFPVFAYDHDNGCVIVGGHVYRGSDPQLYGHYVFADFCSGKFWTVYPDGNGGFNHTEQLTFENYFITAFGEDNSGEMYAGNRGGNVYQITDISCKNNNIQVCHTNGKTLCIGFDMDAIADHMAHGDELGECDGSSKVSQDAVSLRVTPNPSVEHGTVDIEMEVSETQMIKAELYDMKGALVRDLYYGQIESGRIERTTISNGDTKPGVYILKIRGENSSQNHKLIVH